MKQKINLRLILIAILAVLSTTLCITVVYYNLFKEQVKKDLRIEAGLLKCVALDELAKNNELLSGKEIRITIISADGSVLYDNDADAEALKNHKNRPEIKAAFENGSGESVRDSDTMNMRTFYYAVLLSDGTVLRVATEARSIISVFFSSFGFIFLIIMAVILLCAIISHLLTKQLIQPIKDMADNLDDVKFEAGYKELAPFVAHIRKQHEDVLLAAKMKQDFTANVSHELKTPLTAISGYAELISLNLQAVSVENEAVQENSCNDTAKTANINIDVKSISHFSEEIRKNADRLVTLINDIIRLSELDHNDSMMSLSQIDMYEVAKERIEILKVNAAKHNVTLELKGESCFVLSNRDMLIELIDNLCQNAIRYNVPGGKVRVYIMKKNNKPILTVSDTGIGIPNEDKERVFERFYRVDKSRSRQTGGTGLGLAIVKHIVEIHDGTISLESEVNKGTTIRVEL